MADFHAAVLAAGGSTRFGAAKLLAPWRGGRLIHGALAAALAAPVGEVVVVTGDDPGVGRAAAAYADATGEAGRLRLARSEDPGEGIAASIRAAVSALPASAQGMLILLADMPLVPAGLAARVIAALTADALAAAPWRDGRPGHPVALRRALFPDLMALRGDRGAGPILAGLGDGLVRLPVKADGAFLDVDVPADLARLQAAGAAQLRNAD
jgi:molybdenum cofactor cytidylyltransferase